MVAEPDSPWRQYTPRSPLQSLQMIFAIPALLLSLGSIVAAQPEPTCTRSQECRQMALDAASREDFEAFHSLAWRAVQTGKPNDAELMFLLARAQSLSNRPSDALLMLRRLAERGIVTDAATEPDFDAARRLPGWPELEAIMNRAAAAAASTAAAPARSVGAAPSVASEPSVALAPSVSPAPPVPSAPSVPPAPPAVPSPPRVAVPAAVAPTSKPIPAPPAAPAPVPAASARPSAAAPAAPT